ncbi:MAG: zeta toxin family protein [Ramlibacter sp.]|nr:zeta toxin family protein [Ramlibacter sp.]
MPVLHLIAGPNGAGKSTLYDCLIAPRHPALPFVNAQIHEAAQLQHLPSPQARAQAARAWADAECQALLRASHSFVTETAMSHPSRLALITQARSLGYEVVLYALCVDEPRRLLERVSQRLREGGHAVPSHKVLERYPRCVDHLRRAVRMADLALLLDGCDAAQGGPRLIASIVAGHMQLHTVLRPRWVEKVLGFAEA